MTTFKLHTVETAPEGSKSTLNQFEKGWGSIPNLTRISAEAPTLLEGMMTLRTLCEQTSFTPEEKQILHMTVSYENESRYCMSLGSVLAKMLEMPAEDIQALRDGRALKDWKLEALRTFTGKMIRAHGRLTESDLKDFFAVGYSHQQALEIVAFVAFCVMTNFTNNMANTPLDDYSAAMEWTPPVRPGLAPR